MPEDATRERWTLTVTPYVWAASLRGRASVAGTNTNVHVPFKETLNHLDFVFMGRLEATNGRLGFFLDGEHVNTSQEQSAFQHAIGLRIKTSSVEAGAFYRIYERPLGGHNVFGEPLRFAVEPMVGARWTKLQLTTQTSGLSVTKGSNWTVPFVGVRLSTDLNERWRLSGQADFGGLDGSRERNINAQVAVGYRIKLPGRPTTLEAGYRVLSQRYRTRDFTGNTLNWDVRQYGPMLGLSMSF